MRTLHDRQRTTRARRCLFGTILVLTPSHLAAADDPVAFFESRIRPLLERACIDCHAGADAAAGLCLTDRAGWEDSGAIVPGDPAASRLLARVRSTDPRERMPPPAAGAALSPAEIGLLDTWIALGAVDPRAADVPAAPALRARPFTITPADAAWWAFQPLALPAANAGDTPAAAATIDRLVRNGLEGSPVLTPSPPATPREIVRRATFDLHGLPPTPEAVAAFEADPSPAAWRALVDGLLGARRYGERWGRHWLDWVRYAETNGYERDSDKPDAWRYRDYVIDTFATDRPYDRFVIEQLAGDELADAEGLPAGEERRRRLIATGFLRLHQWDDEPASAALADLDDADDVLGTIGAVFLGLTVSCARCHDHKYDPLSQRDYYGLLAFVRGVEPYGMPHTGGGSRGRGRIQRPLDDGAGGMALAAVELPEPPATFVLQRGDIHAPGERVEPAVPAILVPLGDAPSPIAPIGGSSGRRLALARWIIGPGRALSARVMANRVWQRHFGTGIVATPDDFGRTGAAPTNAPLLDYLAFEFVASGWSVHHLHRIVMTSDTYRMTSRATSAAAQAADPEARHVWRQSLRRLDAEAIRDSFLAIAGHLGTKTSGVSVYPSLPAGVEDAANQASFRWPESPPEEQDCRSVFLGVRRALRWPLLEALDVPTASAPTAVRSTTTTAPQALALLNDRWVHAQAARLRDRLHRDTDGRPAAMIERLWALAYQRRPNADEAITAERFVDGEIAAGVGSDAAWQALCHAVLCTSETITVD